MVLKIKKVKEDAILPTRGSKKAAGIDLYACIKDEIKLQPGESTIIPSGIICEFPENCFGLMTVRSSIGIKRNLGLMNQIGVIDEDYRSEIKIALKNFGNKEEIIQPNERVAQLIILSPIMCEIKESTELTKTERGTGGIGSTGRF